MKKRFWIIPALMAVFSLALFSCREPSVDITYVVTWEGHEVTARVNNAEITSGANVIQGRSVVFSWETLPEGYNMEIVVDAITPVRVPSPVSTWTITINRATDLSFTAIPPPDYVVDTITVSGDDELDLYKNEYIVLTATVTWEEDTPANVGALVSWQHTVVSGAVTGVGFQPVTAGNHSVVRLLVDSTSDGVIDVVAYIQNSAVVEGGESAAMSITIKPAAVHRPAEVNITEHPQDQTFDQSGTPQPLSATATGYRLSYQWFGAIGNAERTAIPGATGEAARGVPFTFDPAGFIPHDTAGTWTFHVVVTSLGLDGGADAVAASNPATITIIPPTLTFSQNPITINDAALSVTVDVEGTAIGIITELSAPLPGVTVTINHAAETITVTGVRPAFFENAVDGHFDIAVTRQGVTEDLRVNVNLSLRDKNLADWLYLTTTTATSGSTHTYNLTGNETLAPQTLALADGVNNVTIVLRGEGGVRTVQASANGATFIIGSGITLMLEENITLMGRGPNAVPATANHNNHVVRVNSGATFIMNNNSSRITGNTSTSATAASLGGAVLVNNGGIFIMNNGEISDNVLTIATANSAAVHIAAGGRFYMHGGRIRNNRHTGVPTNAQNRAGGVFNAGTFRTTGGTIYGFDAAAADANTYVLGGVGDTGARNNALINVGGTAEFGTGLGTTFTSVGVINSSSMTINVQAGTLTFPRPPLANINHQFYWIPRHGSTGGTYDIDLNADHLFPHPLVLPERNVTIRVNGVGGMRTLRTNVNGAMFTIGSGTTLELDNVTLMGRGPNSNPVVAQNNNHVVRVNAGATFVMDNGSKIIGNQNNSTAAANFGSAIMVNGTFIMNDGEISGNNINAAQSSGAAVHISDTGIFEMHGGEIRNNRHLTAPSFVVGSDINPVGGIYNEGTFRITDGVVFGFDAPPADQNTFTAGVTGAGNNALSNFDGGTAEFGAGSGSAFIPASNINSTDLTIRAENGALNIPMPADLAGQLYWIPRHGTIGGTYSITVDANQELARQELPSGRNVTIVLQGVGGTPPILRLPAGAAHNGAMFTIGAGNTLRLESITVQRGTAATIGHAGNIGQGDAANSNALVVVEQGGTLIMETGSKIAGNANNTAFGAGGAAPARPGAVRVYGTFIMNDGEISGNRFMQIRDNASAGVHIMPTGTFFMHGGVIRDNGFTQAQAARIRIGAIYNEGTFRTTGGVIYGSDAPAADANFFVMGGASPNNTAESGIGSFAVLRNYGNTAVAEFGTGTGTAFTRVGDINSTSLTINVQAGTLNFPRPTNVQGQLDWIREGFGGAATAFTIDVTENEYLFPQLLLPENITITIRGVGARPILQANRFMSPGAPMFTAANNTLVFENLILHGRGAQAPGAPASLAFNMIEVRDNSRVTIDNVEISRHHNGGTAVRINGGTFVMYSGEIYRFDASVANGSTSVHVAPGGTFEMHGGYIRRNHNNSTGAAADRTGGVWNQGTFRISGGTIFGVDAPVADANTINNPAQGIAFHAVRTRDAGVSQRGTFDAAGTFTSLGDLPFDGNIGVTLTVEDGVVISPVIDD